MACQCKPASRIIGVIMIVGLAVLIGWYIGSRAGSDQPVPIAEQPAAPGGTYTDVAGRIVRISPEEGIITIAHEEIKGFMAAMTMDFRAAEPRELKGLQPGQKILFDLVKIDGQYLIIRIRPASTSQASANQAPQEHPNPLNRGDLVPDLNLVDSQGNPFNLRRMPARHNLITFFYARCPLDTYCPAQSRRLAQLQDWIRENNADLHLVSLTLDADHDNTGILAGYAQRFAADPARWTLAGGNDASAIRDFADRVGGRIQLHENGFQIDHALVAVRIDGDRIVDFVYGLDSMEKLVRGMKSTTQPSATP